MGFVRSNVRESLRFSQANSPEHWREMVAKSRAARGGISEIVIRDDYGELLDGVEEFSHLLILCWGHRMPEKRRSLVKAHPMGRQDLPLVGIFATRSPARPNPILATIVRLVERRGNVLRVQGLDAIDGSPVVDIKPDAPYYHAEGEMKVSDWMRRIHEELRED